MSGNDETQQQGEEQDGTAVDHGSPFRHHTLNDDMTPIKGGSSPIAFWSPVHRNIFHDDLQPSPDQPELHSPPNFQDRSNNLSQTFQEEGWESRHQQHQEAARSRYYHSPSTSADSVSTQYETNRPGFPNAPPAFARLSHSDDVSLFSAKTSQHPYFVYEVPSQQPSSSFESSHGSVPFPSQHYHMQPQPQPHQVYSCGPPSGQHGYGPTVSYGYGPPGPHAYYYNWAPEPPPPAAPVEYIRDVKPSDVLCGRGGATNSHSGNRSFRALVKRHQHQYLKAKKRDKPAVADILIDLIRERGGRFLKRADTKQNGGVVWIDIGVERAREKACQALREGAPELRRRKGKSANNDGDDDDITKEGSGDDDESDERLINRALVGDTKNDSLGAVSIDHGGNVDDGKIRDVYYPTDARDDDDEGSHSTVETNDVCAGPIMIKPYQRLMRRKIEEISVEELTPHERELYLGAFLPPHPPIKSGTRRKRKIIFARSPCAFANTTTDCDDNQYEDRDFAEI